MIYLYRCLSCLQVFSSKEEVEKHGKTCLRAGVVTLTLDRYLKA
jgi:hypothetical protein